MVKRKPLVDQLLRDEGLVRSIQDAVLMTFRPIREESGLDFDFRRTTRFTLPDSLPQRVETLIQHVVHEVADRLIPVLAQEASEEAKHQLIRKLGDVLN